MRFLVDLVRKYVGHECSICHERFFPWETQAPGRSGLCCFCAGWNRPRALVSPEKRQEMERPMGESNVPIPSPWVYSAGDYLDRKISITVPFDTTSPTNPINGPVTVFRDAACLYTRIYIGVGADGSPASSAKVFNVPAGTTTISQGQLTANGIATLADAMGTQISAGP